MHISARADYALRTCVILAAEAKQATASAQGSARPLPAEVIALRADLPTKFLETVIVKLRQAGIVHSHRGAGGGCQLARPAEDISLLDVVTAVDGPVMSVRGLNPSELSYDDHAPGLAAAYIEVNNLLLDHFGSLTIASLLTAVTELPK